MTMITPLLSLHRFGLAVAALLAALLAGGQTQMVGHDAVNKSEPIPIDRLGAVAGKQYQGDGLSVTATPDGARLRCVFQRLEGQVTREGLWLTSTAEDSKGERFRLVAVALGRAAGERSAAVCEAPAAALRERSTRCGWVCDHSRAPLARTGVVEVVDQIARFIRPGLTEEYTVSVDGVRQDFVVGQRPGGEGPLRVELGVAGAKAEPLVNGVRLVLEGGGRKLAYSWLRVVDARGRELAARLEVAAATRLAVVVEDAAAAYPVGIDPTFRDADWISLGCVPGTDGQVNAAVADGAGNVYIGGSFTVVGDVIANRIAKWDGSAWSALGSGIDGEVYALAVSGTDLYAGGWFTAAGGVAANSIAKWDGSVWSALGSGMGGEYPYVSALAVSGTDLYAGGGFTTAGGTAATNIAKWNGTGWSALGSGMGSPPSIGHDVSALAVSGTDLYAGGSFTTAGNKVSGYVAKAIVGAAGGRFGSLGYSPATGFSFTFSDATIGQTFRIQTSPSLALGSWTNLTNFTYSGPIFISDTSALAAPKEFYRAVTP